MSVHFVSLKGERPTNEDSHNIILGLNDENKDKTLYIEKYLKKNSMRTFFYLNTHGKRYTSQITKVRL